ncbi:hypothetical protein [Bacteroides ovatus]|uniref:hypothetical protein n=1 Tax=Bacteroides ovatus TaxID=28116 RepID=UPI003B5283D1
MSSSLFSSSFYVKAEYHTSAGHYAQPFDRDSRKLFKIGVNFSAKMRNIEKWIVEVEEK